MKNWIYKIMILAFLVSCSNDSEHDKAERCYQNVLAFGDFKAYQTLLRGMRHGSYWKRYYSYFYLGSLAVNFESSENIGAVACKGELIQLLSTGIEDQDRGIRLLTVRRLQAVGADGVAEIFDELLKLVRQCEDNSLSWSAVDALGTFISDEHTETAVAVLVEALSCESINQAVPHAPTIREKAARALFALVEGGHITADVVIEKARSNVDDSEFMMHVESILTGN